MVIIEVLWHVRKGQELDFLTSWKTRFTIADRTRLIGEFLCEPATEIEDLYRSWRIQEFEAPKEDITAFVNVALWHSFEDFKREIDKYIPKPGAPPPPWQVGRYRIVLRPIAWRLGDCSLPAEDSSGTE